MRVHPAPNANKTNPQADGAADTGGAMNRFQNSQVAY
jgi:hypothetical protein